MKQVWFWLLPLLHCHPNLNFGHLRPGGLLWKNPPTFFFFRPPLAQDVLWFDHHFNLSWPNSKMYCGSLLNMRVHSKSATRFLRIFFFLINSKSIYWMLTMFQAWGVQFSKTQSLDSGVVGKTELYKLKTLWQKQTHLSWEQRCGGFYYNQK